MRRKRGPTKSFLPSAFCDIFYNITVIRMYACYNISRFIFKVFAIFYSAALPEVRATEACCHGSRRETQMVKSFEDLVPNAPTGRFDGIRRPYRPADVHRLRGSVPVDYTLAEKGANRLWHLLHEQRLCLRARRCDRQPGHADGARRPRGDLPFRLAGCGRQQYRRRDVPGPEPLSLRIPDPNCASGSTALLHAPTRSNMRKAPSRATGLRRSSPTPRPASEDRSMPSRSCGISSRPASPPCISRINWLPRRNAVISAARC